MILDSKFENWKHIALIAALRVKITNTTEAMVRLSGYGFTYDPAGLQGLMFTLDGDERLELDRELCRRQERQHYGIPLRNHATVPAGPSVTGWVGRLRMLVLGGHGGLGRGLPAPGAGRITEPVRKPNSLRVLEEAEATRERVTSSYLVPMVVLVIVIMSIQNSRRLMTRVDN